MKYLLLTLVFFLISCTYCDCKIESMPYKELTYRELPSDIKKHLSVQNSISRMTIGSNDDIMLINKSDSDIYRLEYVETIIGPWTECIKLINTPKNIVYRIEQGTPSPFIIYKDKLYIPNKYLGFCNGDYRLAKYREYVLK